MEPTESSYPSCAEKAPNPLTPEVQELSTGERFSLDLDRINAAIEAMLKDTSTDPSALKEAWAVRAALADNFVNSLEPTPDNPNPRPRVKFDILVDKALIFEKVGNQLRYLEELDDAEAFAFAEHLEEVLPSLSEEIDEKSKELGDSPEELVLKLRGHITYANRYYLREQLLEGIDYDDFLGAVYGMIFDEDGEPEDVFAALGITE